MARHKNWFQKRRNFRWLRWAVTRALVRLVPVLRRQINFFGRAVPVEAVGAKCVGAVTLRAPNPFDDAEQRFIAERCAGNDKKPVPEYWRKDPDFSVEYHLVRKAWVLGHTGAVVAPDYGALVGATAYTPNWNADKARLRLRPRSEPGVVVPVGPVRSYFHFFADVAFPLLDYFALPERPQERHMILLHEGTPAFARLTLEVLADQVGAEVGWIGPGERVHGENVLFVVRRRPCEEWFLCDRARAERLRAALEPLVAPVRAALQPQPRLYLSRGDAPIRRLRNAAEVEEALAVHGFAAFVPRADNFPEQVARLAAAEQVVAVHGAALTNALFVPPGASVLEIFPENFCKSPYMHLCKRLGLRYSWLVGGPGDYDQTFTVDAAALESRLQAWTEAIA